MIEKITFNKSPSSSLNYISLLPAIEAMEGSIEFKKGLNIIVGPNGSGKSSILKAIGETLAASQYGESCLSKSYLMEHGINLSISKTSDKENEEYAFNFPFDIIHDGQSVLYVDPKRSTGINHGKVDEESMQLGLLETLSMSKESSGEQSNRRVSQFLNILMGTEPLPQGLGATFNVEDLNDTYKKLVEVYVKKVFSPKIKKGQVTILLDEPESSLGMINQVLLWEKILKSSKIAEKFQIILVSHNQECLNIEGANYIEMRKDYLSVCRRLQKGTISLEEASKYASNVLSELTKKEINLLKKIKKLEDAYSLKKENKEISRLLEINFIESWQRRLPKKEGQRFESSFDIRYENVYTLTAKGEQFLSMHLK